MTLKQPILEKWIDGLQRRLRDLPENVGSPDNELRGAYREEIGKWQSTITNPHARLVTAQNYGELTLVEKNHPAPHTLAGLAGGAQNFLLPFSHELNESLIPAYLQTNPEDTERLDALVEEHDGAFRRREHVMDQYFGTLSRIEDLTYTLDRARKTAVNVAAIGPSLEEIKQLHDEHTTTADWNTNLTRARGKLVDAVVKANVARAHGYAQGRVTAVMGSHFIKPFFEAYTGEDFADAQKQYCT